MNRIILIILLAVTFFLPFFSAQNFSPSGDEITHLPSGYSYWKTGQITLNPQHPPFVKLMSALPLLFMDLKFDNRDPNLSGPLKNEWVFGKNFLASNNMDRLLFWGRLPVMLFSVLLGFYIYLWASEMFSPKAGLLSLFLYAFMPNIIAHAQFVTTDLALTSFSFMAFYYLWKFFRTNLNRHLIYSGLFFGLALSSKFSAVVFLPVILFLIFIYTKSRHPVRSLARAKNASPKDLGEATSNGINSAISRFAKLAAVIFIPAFLVIYFSYFMPTDTGFYLRGLRSVYADQNPSFLFYLNGQFSKDGWWYYFLEGFLLKTPIPALIAFVAALVLYKKLSLTNRDKLFIFLPLVSFVIVTSFKAHDIGIRYLLPAFPFLILYAGGLAIPLEVSLATKSRVRRTSARLLLMGLGLWYVFSAISIYPDYLAYFNEFVGGPASGYKYMDDSNLEWKHDLKRLAEYQNKYPDTKVIYTDKNVYINPGYYGVKNIIPQSEQLISNPSGKYAININLLVRLKGVSQTLNNKKLDWLSLYQPIDRVGYSYLVYEFK